MHEVLEYGVPVAMLLRVFYTSGITIWAGVLCIFKPTA